MWVLFVYVLLDRHVLFHLAVIPFTKTFLLFCCWYCFLVFLCAPGSGLSQQGTVPIVTWWAKQVQVTEASPLLWYIFIVIEKFKKCFKFLAMILIISLCYFDTLTVYWFSSSISWNFFWFSSLLLLILGCVLSIAYSFLGLRSFVFVALYTHYKSSSSI